MRISDWSSDVCSSDLSHTIKAGYVESDNDYTEDTRYTGADSALYRSIAIGDSGTTFDEFPGAGWTGTRSIVAGDTTRIITAINNSADSAYYMGLLDGNGDGTITDDELGAYQFDSTAGNPTGQVNNYRIRQSGPAPYTVT